MTDVGQHIAAARRLALESISGIPYPDLKVADGILSLATAVEKLAKEET